VLRHSFAHGPGRTGVRELAEANHARVGEIVASRLEVLRRHMEQTLAAMTGSIVASRRRR
jgi:hypothetical protein